MSRLDIYHHVVIRALEKDDWTITDNPLRLTYGGRHLFVDIGAERLIGAERRGTKIAVEVKSFLGQSDIVELQSSALGQYVMYRDLLKKSDPERHLYLAVTKYTFDGIFSEPLGELVIQEQAVSLLVFDRDEEEIFTWVKTP
jgi:hypothetical protein